LMPPIVPQYISAEVGPSSVARLAAGSRHAPSLPLMTRRSPPVVQDLAVLLKATPIADAGSNIAVVDVRDDDFRVGVP
jgi:hypothetical protein